MDLLLSILHVASSEHAHTPPSSSKGETASDFRRASNTNLRLKSAIKTRPRLNAITTSRRVHFAQIPPKQNQTVMRWQREMEINFQKECTDKLILRAQRQSRYAMEYCGRQASQLPASFAVSTSTRLPGRLPPSHTVTL